MPDEDETTRPVTGAAIGFSVEAKFNQSRSAVAQFHMAAASTKKELFHELKKVCEVFDLQDAVFMIRGLKITLERDTEALKRQQEQVTALKQGYQDEFVASGRKGSFELKGQQKTNVDNQNTSMEAAKERIEGIKRDIAELEAMVAEVDKD